MIHYLKSHFPRGYHYLIRQSEPGEIDGSLKSRIFDPAQKAERHNIWGQVQNVSEIGRRLGWVPDHFPLIFFSDTVVQEIANSMASRDNRVNGNEEEKDSAGFLLDRLGLSHLADRQPYFLSEGETKAVWFLCQWVKGPEYLIIGHLPSVLSERSQESILSFLEDSESLARTRGFLPSTLILGYLKSDRPWYGRLLSDEKWQLVERVHF